MSDVAVRLEHVYKKFRKGEVYNSLRDLIPALTGKMFRQQSLSASDKREFWALEDISFEVEHGEAFAIIGANGAGKSTMLKLLSRVMKPTRGSFFLSGRCSALIELGAGFHQDLTGRENAFLYGSILGMTQREIAAKFDAIVEFSGLEEFIDTPIKRYSSGMYARLGYAVASHVNPDVLLVDEILSVGDFVFQRKCIEHMKQVIKGGATVLFVSHNLRTVSELCQRCLLLERGRSLMMGPAEQVVSSYLERSRMRLEGDISKRQVSISKVKVRNQFEECSRFQSGEKVWIDVELRAHTRCVKLSLSLYITDDQFREVFNTSTERLGHGNFTLEAGEVFACTFELSLNMTSGIFHPSILIYRYDTQMEYDRWAPATTIYVNSEQDVQGGVHCFPSVVRYEVRRGSDAGPAEMAEALRGDGHCLPNDR
jgi:ABC-type polysaccharide/polyol phosphate transport system ATPase subunit